MTALTEVRKNCLILEDAILNLLLIKQDWNLCPQMTTSPRVWNQYTPTHDTLENLMFFHVITYLM